MSHDPVVSLGVGVTAVGTSSSAAEPNRPAQALAQFHAGQLDSALALAQEQLTDSACSRPVRAEMHHIEAACFYQTSRLTQAEQAIRRAIAIDPSSATYLNTYGVILRKRERLEEAVRSYEVVMQLQPDFADVYYNCGNALNDLERTEEAVARFKRCLEINPGHASAHHNIANCLRDLKNLEEALEHYARSDELEHQNPDMHCNWGLTWQLKERWDLAIDQFEVAIGQKSDHAHHTSTLGVL